MGGSAATVAASSAAATAAGGAFSESAGDPAAVDPFASRGAGGFACPVSTGGAAGSATVVGCEAAAGGASLDFSTRVELCEKLSAALTTGAGATCEVAAATRDAICHVPEIRGGS